MATGAVTARLPCGGKGSHPPEKARTGARPHDWPRHGASVQRAARNGTPCSDCPLRPARRRSAGTPAQHMTAPRRSKRSRPPNPDDQARPPARTPSPSPSAQLPRGHGKSWRPGKHATAGSGTPVSRAVARTRRFEIRGGACSAAAFLFAAGWGHGGSRDSTACAYGASTWFCSPSAC
jgi:hypothetical protein